MQKKLIVLAVAAALTAPTLALADNANITFYGKAHLSLDSNNGNAGTTATGTKNGLNLTSNSSRFGLKGAEDLGGGVNAIYQYETEVLAQGGNSLLGAQRDTYLGLKGGLGTVVAGRLPLANMYANDANFFGDKVGDAGNMTAGGFGGNGAIAVPSRSGRAIGYMSPAFSGMTVTAGFVPNSAQSLSGAFPAGTTPATTNFTGGATQNQADKASSFALRAAYDQDGIFGAFNYLNLGVAGVNVANGSLTGGAAAGAKVTVTSFAGGYSFGVAQVRAQYVLTDANAAATANVLAGRTGMKQGVFTVGGQYKLSETGAINAQVAKAGDVTVSGASQANSGATLLAVGYDYSLSKRTTVYGAYAKVSNKANAAFSATGYAHGGLTTPGAGNSPSALSVGVIHNF
ncbi:MAG: porin [Sideroxydans sp.]|nr:porin [Sideroxydans sp.]